MRDLADNENQLLVTECVGLLSLLDKDLFENYSRIFLAILWDSLSQDSYDMTNESDEIKLKQAILALKASFDGLIFYGVNERSERLQQIIVKEYIYSKDSRLR